LAAMWHKGRRGKGEGKPALTAPVLAKRSTTSSHFLLPTATSEATTARAAGVGGTVGPGATTVTVPPSFLIASLIVLWLSVSVAEVSSFTIPVAPPPAAEFPDTVLKSSVSLPALLKRPPPACCPSPSAWLPEKVLFSTVAVPNALKRPPLPALKSPSAVLPEKALFSTVAVAVAL